MLQYLQKSHRCIVQDVNWQVDIARCKEVSTQSIELADSKFIIRLCEWVRDCHLTPTQQFFSYIKLFFNEMVMKFALY